MIKATLHFHISINITRTPAIKLHEQLAGEGFKSVGVPLVELDEDPTHVIVLLEDGSGGVRTFCEQQHALGRKTSPSYESLPWHLNKLKQNELAVSLEVPAPKTIRIRYSTTFEEIVDQVGLPFYYKPSGGLGGNCIQYIRSESEFHPMTGYIAQQSVGRPGTDIAAVVIKNQVVAANWRVANSPEAFQSLQRHPSRAISEFTGITPMINDLPAIQEVCSPIANAMANEISVFNLLKGRDGTFYFNEINHVSIYAVYPRYWNLNPFELYAQKLIEEDEN